MNITSKTICLACINIYEDNFTYEYMINYK